MLPFVLLIYNQNQLLKVVMIINFCSLYFVFKFLDNV